ncbi:MAG: hypothetical protein Q7R97_01990 [Candidatus Daviesbacteria bacterium]|nr:hypothetical protein [Candidatus Daviesbacteria bacterium]
MTTDDLKQIRGVIKEELSFVEGRFDNKLSSVETKLTSVETGLSKRLTSVETGLSSVKEELTSVETRLEQKIEESEKHVMSDIAQFINDRIAPMFEEKADKSDIERIERKLDSNLAMNLDQKYRLEKIESLPTIAHELKIKKH